MRAGPREPISPAVRRVVKERDGARCQWCGSPYDPQLDHQIPWSAYGPDDPWNLRILCKQCNNERSNYDDPTARQPRLPVTACCFWCAIEESLIRWYHRSAPDDPNDRIHAYCRSCGLTSWVPAESWLLGSRYDPACRFEYSGGAA